MPPSPPPPPELSILVPLYDEGPTLTESLERLAAAADASPWRWEMVLVDDGSRDDSRATGDAFAARHDAVRTAHHARNRGRGAAVKTGVAAARAPIAGFLDIDLEVSERFLQPCVQAVADGADLVVGDRSYDLAPRSWLRHVLSRGYARLARWALGTSVRDTESGCKWFDVRALAPIVAATAADGWFFDTEIVLRSERAGLTIAQVPVEFVRRFDKISTVRPLRDSLVYLGALMRFRRRLAAERRAARRRAR